MGDRREVGAGPRIAAGVVDVLAGEEPAVDPELAAARAPQYEEPFASSQEHLDGLRAPRDRLEDEELVFRAQIAIERCQLFVDEEIHVLADAPLLVQDPAT